MRCRARRRRPAAPLALDAVAVPDDLGVAWLELLGPPNIASKRWIYQQYDHLVGANTIRRPGGDAAVIRIPGMDRALAITTDCAERHCELDPRGGGRASVFEAARNIACTGAVPYAASDCLNFANPEKGEHRLATGRGDRGHERGARGALRYRSSRETCPCTTRARSARSTRLRSSA